MIDVCKINGVDLNDYKESYVVIHLFEHTISNFYKLNNDDKLNLARRYDDLFSEFFSMPTADVVFEDKEFVSESERIYLGDVNNINSGFEFIFRYFFAKRQQYQLICISKNETRDYGEEELTLIKEFMNKSPITNKFAYRPFSTGLNNYLMNYNKVDAIIFSFNQLNVLLDMIVLDRTYNDLSIEENLKLSKSISTIIKQKNKIYSLLNIMTENKLYQKLMLRRHQKFYDMADAEQDFLDRLKEEIDGRSNNFDADEKYVFFCFNENVWRNLTLGQKIAAVEKCNKFLKDMLGCTSIKKVTFEKQDNSYEFGDSKNVYCGDLGKDAACEILQRLVYEYSFNKNYEKVLELDEDEKAAILCEYKRCAELYKKQFNYDGMEDCSFIKCVRETSVDLLNKIYKYISKNLVVNGKKIPMGIDKTKFILDIVNLKKRR